MAKKQVVVKESAGGHWAIYQGTERIGDSMYRRSQDAVAFCRENNLTVQQLVSWHNPIPVLR